MAQKFSVHQSGTKTMLLLPLLALFTLTFCTKKADSPEVSLSKKYSVPELQYNAARSAELGIPTTWGAHFTNSGELFTGTQRIYFTANDSLIMELFFEDGINTGSVMQMDEAVVRQVHGIYLDSPYLKEMYFNEMLAYEDVPPTENEDGVGYKRTWHRNGQLGAEVSYTGRNIYHGLMTEYDEEGNIIKQDRYENGELVEKIK